MQQLEFVIGQLLFCRCGVRGLLPVCFALVKNVENMYKKAHPCRIDPILVFPTLNMASTFNPQNILILRYRARKIAVPRDKCHYLEVSWVSYSVHVR
jgi:hypothetical protein